MIFLKLKNYFRNDFKKNSVGVSTKRNLNFEKLQKIEKKKQGKVDI